ncbi:MAG: MFS transporter [Thermaerobacter sp.]|nr:MFS transporter [Thermaerobacter sp.]
MNRKGGHATRRTTTTIRAFYLATGIAGGIYLPYLTIVLGRDHVTPGQIGGVLSFGILVAILAQPLWGAFVDRYRKVRLTLFLTALAPGIVALLYNIPSLWVIAFAAALFNLFAAPQAPISDSYAVDHARRAGASYGSIRLFGSIGWALGAYAGGLFLARFAPHWLWIPFLTVSALTALTALTFPGRPDTLRVRRGLFNGVGEVLRDRRFGVFLLGGFLASQTLAAFNSFFVVAFRDVGGPISETGMAFLLASLSNVPPMLFASRLINRVGPERTMLWATGTYVIRWGLMVAFPVPPVYIGAQLLHGLSFGLYYVAAVHYVSHLFPQDLQATGQSIFGMVVGGLAGIFGNLVNGYLLEWGGASAMFLSCVVSTALAAACFYFIVRKPEWHLKTRPASLTVDHRGS